MSRDVAVEHGENYGAMDGVRVIELGSMVAVPFAAAGFAALGADVIKVEPLTGDPTRAFTSMRAPDDIAPAFLASNAGKRSVALDLTHPDGLETLLALIAGADVVLDNLRPGGLRRRGLDVDALLVRHPQLTWVSVSGFGDRGPGSGRSAVDQVIQAESGIVSVTGPPTGAGYRVGFHVVDHAAAHAIVARVLAALLRRGRTGAGERIRLSLYQVALSLQSTAFAEYFVTGAEPARTGNASPLSAPSDAVRTSDGWIMLVAYLEPHWNALCRLIDRPELLTDPRFVGRDARVRHRGELIAELERSTCTSTTDTLADRLEAAGIMVGRVRRYPEVAHSAEVTDNEFLAEVDLPGGITHEAIRSLYDGPGSAARVLPRLGEHTREVLAEIGADTEDLVARKIAGVPGP
ncbi:CoA transferase [Nocardia sp. NPDC050799]|uniref:CaiB/BaiF CoA transferase family protein n=1 Tax=Nocardia sp. NPDC050799 TaxID=3154842 RepID=UPI003411E7ED